MTELTKRCTRCATEKPLSAYWRDSRASDGRHSRCGQCQTATDHTAAERKRRWRGMAPQPRTKAIVPIIDPHPEWRDQAACANHPNADDWFASPDQAHAQRRLKDAEKAAIAVCAGCPVRAECLEYALVNAIDYGIHGGLPPERLRALRRQRHIKGAS